MAKLPCKADFIYFNNFITCVWGGYRTPLKKNLGESVFSFSYVELRSSGVGSKHLYLLGHLQSPAKIILEAITRIVDKKCQ